MATRLTAAALRSLAPWQWALAAGVIVLALVSLLIAVRLYLTRNDLPGCETALARQTLTTIFRENNVAATGTDDVRQVSRSESEVACTAVATLADGALLDVSYRMLREQGRPVVRASWTRRTQ